MRSRHLREKGMSLRPLIKTCTQMPYMSHLSVEHTHFFVIAWGIHNVQ